MLKRTRAFCIAGAAAILFAGCTHQQLKYNTVQQSGTLSRIYEQQVLDNLAMFVVDNQAIPNFALPSAGSSNVTDTGVIAASPINRLQTVIGLEGSRGMQEAWTLDPIRDPAKLQRMRCAYQRAVGIVSTSCPNCCKLEAQFRGEKYDPKKCDAECSITCGWFETSSNRLDVPKDQCSVYGEYCGCYVWVCPEYRHEFAKLVFTILDYAANDPPAISKVVTYKKGSDFEQKVIVPAGTTERQLKILLGLPLDKKSDLPPDMKRAIRKSIIERSKRPTPSRSSGILNLEQNLRNLAPR